jgi:Spy/CpxP family protein refolding chaperone
MNTNFGKKLLTVAGLLALGISAPAVFGQQANPPAQTTQAAGMHGHGDPFAGLNLTDDQKTQIKKIHMDAKAKAEAVKADTSLSDADKQAKIKEIHRGAMADSEKLLTPEQRAQFKEQRKERREEKKPQQ